MIVLEPAQASRVGQTGAFADPTRVALDGD
jgi:hypothetical protein